MIPRRQFDTIANQVWKKLQPLISPELRHHFEKIRFLIEDRPSPELAAELDPDQQEAQDELCGLYVGVPLPEASFTQPDLFPGRVYLFRTALMDFAEYDGTPAGTRRLREEIAITLLHEIGHFFGLDEGDLERLGYH
jgi:predicted Zn-dependent protease with MMP-like domain